jgi:sulfate adenylyltransferase (ADP) / ATP adenylyltransferase
MVTTRRGAETGSVPPSPSKQAMADDGPSRRAPISSSANARNSPLLPSPLERIVLGLFPAILVFGTVFSVFSPETRHAAYDPVSQSHIQDPAFAPSYFARKSNIFNTIFVKRGWAWMTVAHFAFALTHPSVASQQKRVQAAIRWAAVTTCWIFVTQWFFGPAIIDRGFRWTGGKCELAEREVYMGDTSVGEMVTSVACKAAGGKWKGGHDISGHVFLLVLGVAFLLGEVGWPYLRWINWSPDDRTVIMSDGAVKGASVEAETAVGEGQGKANEGLGIGGKFAGFVLALSLWMLLMTAIYFHTWFEKVCFFLLL